MKSIRLVGVHKSYKSEPILQNINLEIPSGKIFVLLGPSGSGKTTLLRLIGGFEAVDSGSIFLGNREITHLDINERPINTVFQNYALFPHLDVFDNVAYSLMIQKMPSHRIKEKVSRILETVRLTKHAHKSINQLSGGQQQRVALARALVDEPDVLLLDEPLAALDSTLREQVLVDLIALQDTLNMTFIYVTHDQFEALTVADQIAIMNHDGEIEQIGTPKELYEFPASSFVASFVGTTTIFEGKLHAKDASIEIDQLGSFAISLISLKPWMAEGARIRMSLRPEKIYITPTEQEGFSNRLEGVVEAIVYHGRSTHYNVRLKNNNLVHVFSQNVEHFPRQMIDYDMPVYLYWQKENAVLLER